jgi:hypothetical protein
MNLRSGVILGLAIGERSILCAQASGVGGRAVVQKLARVDRPEGDVLTHPAEAGAALAAALRRYGFTATRAVIGVPAKWLIAHERELPPADNASARAMLRLQAERLVIADNADLVFDYAGRPDAAAASRVLLVGMLRDKLDRVLQLTRAAGLSVAAVTSTSMTVSELASSAVGDRVMVMLGEHGVELVSRRNGSPAALRHVAVFPVTTDAASVERLAGEVTRAVALSPHVANGNSPTPVLWTGAPLNDLSASALARRAGLACDGRPTLESVGAAVDPHALNGSAAGGDAEQYLPAAALAAAGLTRDRMPFDLAHTRLAAPVKRRIDRRTALAVAAAASIVLGVASLYMTVQQREVEADALGVQLKEMTPDIKAAEAMIARVNYGRGYFETRTPVLACIRELTLSLGVDEAIWISSFTLRETGRGQVQGRAADQRLVLAVLERLNANTRFADVQLQDMRDATGRTREVAYAISFVFTATD